VHDGVGADDAVGHLRTCADVAHHHRSCHPGTAVDPRPIEQHRAGDAGVRSRLFVHPDKDVGAVIDSGSFLHSGMAILPCSSTTLGQVATGSGSNLLCRAAMVTLKERRPLIICHREMPLSLIDIDNMRQATLAGAVMCSPNPGFYLNPRSVEEIVDFVVGKVMDLLHVPHSLKTRWEATLSRPATTMPS
jgi:4-hydroxy-3-polyprenylbenzoate decarboxylase